MSVGSDLQVLVGGRNVQPHYEEIFMFSHRNAKQLSTFLVLHTANNMTLTLSPGHYLFVNGGSKLLRAADAKIGDLVWTLPESQPDIGSVLIPTKLVDIQSSMQYGSVQSTHHLRDHHCQSAGRGYFHRNNSSIISGPLHADIPCCASSHGSPIVCG